MTTRTVRLDDESEAILEEIRRATGLSVSDVLKRGLLAARDALRADAARQAYEIYAELDLGPGGYAKAPAREAKTAIRDVLLRKRRG